MCDQREWRRAYIGLGSNIGDRLKNLQFALQGLRLHPAIRVRAVSAIYETEPVGDVPQPEFLNAVVALDTRLTPEELLELCLNLENERGRVRTQRWGPRTLDVDVLLLEGVRRSTSRLRLPHPELTHRRFVLQPLADVTGDELLEPLGRTARDLLRSCKDDKSVRFYGSADLLQSGSAIDRPVG